MERIKNKMRDEAAEKKGRQEARRQRDARKFGKQVQIAKEQERAKGKREMLDKVKDLKRSKFCESFGGLMGADHIIERKGNASEDVRENPDDDMFESISIEAPAQSPALAVNEDPATGPSFKRQKKDAKFGFGGKKRFGKSGDAASSGDMRGFSAGRMKGRGGRGVGRAGRGRGGGARGRGANSQRLGKSRREAMR